MSSQNKYDLVLGIYHRGKYNLMRARMAKAIGIFAAVLSAVAALMLIVDPSWKLLGIVAAFSLASCLFFGISWALKISPEVQMELEKQGEKP